MVDTSPGTLMSPAGTLYATPTVSKEPLLFDG